MRGSYMGGSFLVLELTRGGSVIKGASLSSFNILTVHLWDLFVPLFFTFVVSYLSIIILYHWIPGYSGLGTQLWVYICPQ